MDYEELLYLLALTKSDRVGVILSKKLIENCGSALGVYQEKKQALMTIPGVGRNALAHVFDKKTLLRAEKELEYILKNGINYWFYQDANYPTRLKQCADGPVLLFSKGKNQFGR